MMLSKRVPLIAGALPPRRSIFAVSPVPSGEDPDDTGRDSWVNALFFVG